MNQFPSPQATVDWVKVFCQQCGKPLHLKRPECPVQGECPSCHAGFVLNPWDLPLPRAIVREDAIAEVPVKENPFYLRPWWLAWFSFKGRLNRMRFFHGWLVTFGTYLGLSFLWFGLDGLLNTKQTRYDAEIGIALVPLYLVVLWIAISLKVRRLHDIGASGWWLLLSILLAVLLPYFVAAIICTVVMLVCFVSVVPAASRSFSAA